MKKMFLALLLCSPWVSRAEPVMLFDGKTLTNWEGNVGTVWRVENGEIVAGTLSQKQPKNDFLCTTRDYSDFELRLSYRRLENNGGIQFRSERVPNHHEVSGYQADFAPGIDGFLYDESRRSRFLAIFDCAGGPSPAPPEGTGQAIKRAMETAVQCAEKLSLKEWNNYRIRVEGKHIELWVNGIKTVDYTEADDSIPRTGKIALQIHSGATEIRYKDIVLEELNAGKKAR
jgi:hypothetical protein